MHTVTVTRLIKAPRADVWEAVDDIGNIAAFHPLLKSSPVTNGIPRGKGAARVCNFHDGNAIAEEVVDYRPNESLTLTITDTGEFPLKSASGGFKVRAVSDKAATVTFSLSFEPKFGPLGWVLARVAMKPQFRRIMNSVLDGLDTHVTNGRAAATNTVLEPAAQS